MKKCPKCGDLIADNNEKCFNCSYVFVDELELERKKKRERELEQERERIKEEERLKTERLKTINDIYEYDIVSVRDSETGSIDIWSIKNILDKHGEDGWKLVNSFTNELGHNSSSYGYTGTNATIDQTILIFERCIKRYNSAEE